MVVTLLPASEPGRPITWLSPSTAHNPKADSIAHLLKAPRASGLSAVCRLRRLQSPCAIGERGVIGFQFGDGGLEGGEVLKGLVEAADDLLALVEEGFHVGDAVDAGHSLRFC